MLYYLMDFKDIFMTPEAPAADIIQGLQSALAKFQELNAKQGR